MTAAREHVAEIERGICTIKERGRCVLSELPFEYFHHWVIVHLIYFVVKWLNAVPAELGISDKYSPREIVTRMKIDYNKDCKFQFGSYLEASEDADVTNTMKPRTRGVISLGTKNNLQQSQKVFDLKTGKVLYRRTCKELPMPGGVIRRMNLWGKRSKKERYGKKLNFLNRVKKEYDWENDELDPMEALEHAEEQRVHPEVLAEFPGIMREEDVPEGQALADEPEQSPAQRVTEV